VEEAYRLSLKGQEEFEDSEMGRGSLIQTRLIT
jgi:hypothetical protein